MSYILHHFVLIWSASVLTKTFENPGFFELGVEKFFKDSIHRASFWHYTCSFRGQSWPKWRCHTRQKFSSQCQHKFLWRKSISSFDTSASRLYLCFFWRIKRLDGNQVHPVIWLSRKKNYQLFPKFCRLKNKFQTSCWEGTLESPCQNYKIRQFTFLLSNQCSGGQPEGWKEKKFEQGKIKCKISFRFVQHFDLCTVSLHSLNTIAAL